MKKSIILYILLGTVASAINYAAYPLLGRILPPTQYVDITVALSILTQITTFLSSIIAITIGLTKEEHTNTKRTLALLQSILFRLFIILIIAFLATSPFIFKSIATPAMFSVPIALMMLISLPMTIVSGYLNGKQLMVKLGIFTVLSAGLQLAVGSIVAFLTKDGFTTMMSMSFAQLCAIVVIYWVFRSDSLPSPLHLFNTKSHAITSNQFVKKLVFYSIAASVAIMFINLTQIIDLIIVTSNKAGDSKFYTDLYIVSRVMFFAGMIFIWPFLGEVTITSLSKNRPLLVKLITIFTAIAATMIGTLALVGPWLIHLLLGVWYDYQAILSIGAFAILFKLFLLVITAITLYFMIFRNYTAVLYSLVLCLALLIYAILHNKQLSTLQTLQQLTAMTFVWAGVGIALFVRHTRQRN